MRPTPCPPLELSRGSANSRKLGSPAGGPMDTPAPANTASFPSRRAFSSGSGKSTPPIFMALALSGLAGMSLPWSATWQGMGRGQFPAGVAYPMPAAWIIQRLSQLMKTGQPGRRPHGHASASKHHQLPIPKSVQQWLREGNTSDFHGACAIRLGWHESTMVSHLAGYGARTVSG